MTPVVILLILAVVAVVGSLAYVGVSRRSKGPVLEPPARPRPDTLAGPSATESGDTLTIEPETPEAPAVEAPVRPSWRDRLSKARGAFAGSIGSILSRSGIDQDSWDELEEALIHADVGVGPATDLLDSVRERVKADGITTGAELVEAVKAEMKSRLVVADRSLHVDADQTNVWLFVGVNGVGKTTTVGKLAKREVDAGQKVMMAAGDTFRAAAAEQLTMWAERSGADIVRGDEGADPASIIFNAIEAAAARGHSLVLADTAGRLHNKSNLMEELRKVKRVASREPGHVTETLLVLDATTGQNGLVQAQQFLEAVDITGVVLTKLDGSAKGGIVFAIQSTLGIPVKLVGLGETADDLIEFDPDAFVDALFAQ